MNSQSVGNGLEIEEGREGNEEEEGHFMEIFDNAAILNDQAALVAGGGDEHSNNAESDEGEPLSDDDQFGDESDDESEQLRDEDGDERERGSEDDEDGGESTREHRSFESRFSMVQENKFRLNLHNYFTYVLVRKINYLFKF
jgi:hypothetical protein